MNAKRRTGRGGRGAAARRSVRGGCRAVVEDLTEVVSRFRADGTFTFVNDVYCRFFGKTRRELIGRTWHPRAVPEDLPLIKARLRTLTPGNPVVVIENRVYSGAGDVRWMQFVNRGFFDAAGRLVGIQSVGRNIPERRQAEIAIRESEDRCRSLVESSRDAGLLTAPDGRILAANDAACRMFGRSEKELVAVGRNGVVDPADPVLAQALQQRARTGRFRGELTFRRRDGTPFPGEISSVVFTDRHGQVRTSMVIRDIPDRRKAESEREVSRRALRALASRARVAREEERARIAREVHDGLGHAFTDLKLDLAWLDRRLRMEGRPAGTAVRRRVAAMIERVEADLDVTRRIATELRPAVLDMLGLVAAMEWAAKEFGARTGIPCTLDLPAEAPALDAGRSTTLFRIFQETLANIARHARASRVRVSLTAGAGRIALEVSDNGRGITPRETGSPDAMGLLGMRERALEFGGNVEIRGRRGRGTIVRVSIPRVSP